MPLPSPPRVRVTPPDEAHRGPFLDAVRRSRALHHPWVAPPDDDAGFDAWRARCAGEDFQALVVERVDDGAFVGVVNISQIFMKAFCSAYLGYWIAAGFAGQGLMSEGLACALDQALGPMGLHRLEANIRPGNAASIALVRRLGFRQEGFSRRYLHLDGAWRDHARWALTAEDWAEARPQVPLPDPLQILRLAPGDEARLRTLRLKALLDAPEAFGSTFDETVTRPPESWVQQLADLPTFVATLRDRDVGMVRAAPDPKDPDQAWLISMWVSPEARGSGASDRLVRAVIQWASVHKKRALLLDVGDHNPRAIALYARHGFTPEGWRGPMPPPQAHLSEHRRILRLP